MSRTKRVCTKYSFGSEAAAESALQRIMATAGAGRRPRRRYQCTRCDGWHLTSQADYDRPNPQRVAGRRRGEMPQQSPARTVRRVAGHKRDTGPTRDVRDLVLQRDGYCCVRCGRSVLGQRYSLQHRRARGMGGTRRPETNLAANLVTTCGTATTGCHGRIEGDHTHAEQWGWRIDQNADPAAEPAWLKGKGWSLLDNEGGYVAAETGSAA